VTRRAPSSAVAVWASRLALAAVFAVAAIHKTAEPEPFARVVFRYQILPYPAINAAAIALPWFELTAAVALLLWPGRRRSALWLMLALLAIFTGATAFNLARGLSVACGCFTSAPDARDPAALLLARNAAAMLLAALALRVHPRPPPASGP